MRRLNDALNRELKGPERTFTLGVALVLAGVAVFLVVSYWWAVLIVGGLLILAASFGWLAINAGHLSRKDFERMLRRLRLSMRTNA
ncbi:MAG: hypothetical protein KGH57_02930 [Candidatus Micrarchaeota archaeon]|nr:hypothetical protein [Candidatus Micrarchaeota archaeon]